VPVPTVVVVGAGGSLAQALSLRRRWRLREQPPLDGDFFMRIALLAEHDEDLRLRVSTLREKVAATQGLVQDPWTVPHMRMEQFFADVYYEVASARSAQVIPVYLDLLGLYVEVLCQTTNWVAVHPRTGCLDHLLQLEVGRHPQDETTVVTFNHDLVLEGAIARAWPDFAGGCLNALYGDLGLTELFPEPRAQSFPRHRPSCRHTRPLLLLKLHGSLNWAVRTRSREPGLTTLFPTNQTRAVYLLNSREAPSTATQIVQAGRRHEWYLWNLVVPPIYEKHRIIGMSTIRRVWDLAYDRLRSATRLVMVGYSMPEPDVSAQQMFRKALSANRNLDEIEVINPNAQLVAKLKETLGVKVIRLYEDVETYVGRNP
jgi:hypothetical protein